MRRSLHLISGLLTIEVLLAGVIFSRGFPYYGSSLIDGAPLWELPVAAFHLPAIQTLTGLGLCCGLSNGLVLRSRVVGGHIPMRVTGTLILAATNWICWTAIALLAHWIWVLTRARRSSAPEGTEGSSP
jgi:hypothetical protein